MKKKILLTVSGIVVALALVYFLGPSVFKVYMLFHERRELTSARRRWDEHGSRDYVIDVKANNILCAIDSSTTYRVLVRNDTVVSVHPLDHPENETFADYCLSYTLIGMFYKIKDTISDRFDYVSVDYDQKLGYPQKVKMDDAGRTDADFNWEVVSFSTEIDSFGAQ